MLVITYTENSSYPTRPLLLLPREPASLPSSLPSFSSSPLLDLRLILL